MLKHHRCTRSFPRSLRLSTLLTTLLYGAHAFASGSNMPWEAPLQSVLDSVQGDKTRAAQLLGISRRTLQRRVAEWAS